jgi:hypothetical protein
MYVNGVHRHMNFQNPGILGPATKTLHSQRLTEYTLEMNSPAKRKTERKEQVRYITRSFRGIHSCHAQESKGRCKQEKLLQEEPHHNATDSDSVGRNSVLISSDRVVPAEEHDNTHDDYHKSASDVNLELQTHRPKAARQRCLK